jgi:LCP family protein required for cell wall assembly
MDEKLSSPKRLSRKEVVFSRVKRRVLKHVWLARIGLLVSVIAGFYFLFLFLGLFLKKTAIGYYGGLLSDYLFTPREKIESVDSRTNILILGKGGVGHEAPDLTDTIIFASISHRNPSIILISLPRDIWVPELRAKLNSTYYWGNQKQEGGGLVLAKSTVEEVLGQPVHYGVVIDFSGFVRIIDVLGGVEVDVERTFVDEKYPIPGRENDDCNGDPEYKCRYETIRFEEGPQLMDGDTALKFVRSRNAEGDEGTDLARAARQQKVLLAVKNKILSRGIMFSPKKVLEIWRVLQESTETDIDASAGAILARRVFQARDKIISDLLPEGLLVNPPISPRYDNLYVFIPKDGDWNNIHYWVRGVMPNN